ncbi:hypothetical protein KKC47_00680 [Patescibacteria group bacterium]|nr:hypothetical protein [Patescibacteria group bacterium]
MQKNLFKKSFYLAVFAAIVALTGYLGSGNLLGIKAAFGYGGGGGAPAPIVYTPTSSDGSETNVPYYTDVTLTREFDDDSTASVTVRSYAVSGFYNLAWSQVAEAGAFNRVAYVLSIVNTATGQPISSLTIPATVTLANLNLPADVSDLRLFSGASGAWSQLSGVALDPAADTISFSTSRPVTVAVFDISEEIQVDLDGDGLVEPLVDENNTGSYSPNSARDATRSIDTNMGLQAAPEDQPLYCTPGTLIKAFNFDAVYYCGRDGRRYVFLNERVFYSWFDDFNSLVEMSALDIARIPLGGNITYRPGTRMVKIESDPKVYAITRGGVLRWVMTEAVAEALYGPNWNQFIDDVPVSFWINYRFGDPITPADVGLE